MRHRALGRQEEFAPRGRRVQLLHLRDADRVVDRKIADRGAPQRADMRAAAERLAEVARQRAQIKSARAGDVQVEFVAAALLHAQVIDRHFARLALHADAFARQFVQRPAVAF